VYGNKYNLKVNKMTAHPEFKQDAARLRSTVAAHPLTQKEVAQYVADLMLELRQLSKSVNLVTLQSLIDLVFYEAFATANPIAIPEEELRRLREMEEEGRKAAGTA
jgi:hypothetical protein